MEIPFLIVLLCGVLTITIEAEVVARHRRSPSGDKIGKKITFPHIVLVGLVDQPVPTTVGIPQKTPYATTSYGPPPPPSFYPTSAYPPPLSYGSPQPNYMAPMMPNQPPMYGPPQTPYQSYQPPMYGPPQTPYQSYQPPMYMSPQMPYPGYQQPLAVGAEQEQNLSEPKPNDISTNIDQTTTMDFQIESTDDLPSTDFSPDNASENKSDWETNTFS